MSLMTKRKIALILCAAILVMCLSTLVSCGASQGEQGVPGVPGQDGADGITPHPGDNGNWWIGDTDTGIPVSGKDGQNGADGANGINGIDGKDGISVRTFEINDDGELVVSFTDDSVVNLGKIVGADGSDGEPGQNGADGKTPEFLFDSKTGFLNVSYDGRQSWEAILNLSDIAEDGVDGVGISNAMIDADGKLVLILSNGDKLDLGVVKGKDGTNGTNGINGTNGEDGTDGVTPMLQIVDDEWMVSYDNGKNWIKLGSPARGEEGKSGVTPLIDINDDGYWVVSMNNGTTWTNLGVRAEGKDGTNGVNGTPGAAGRGISSMVIVDGYLMVTYTDGQTVNVGQVNSTPDSDDEPIASETYTEELAFYPVGDGNQYAVGIGNAIFMSHIVIPSAYNGKPVTEIVPEGFINPEGVEDVLVSVVIPDSIKKIGSRAFSTRTNIAELYVPSSVEEIGIYAFAGVQKVVFEITEFDVPSDQNWNTDVLGCAVIEWGKSKR